MLHPLHTDIEAPKRFTYPFCYEPHPLCQLAAKQVQAYIAAHPEIRADADQGKMFGVLVVENSKTTEKPNNQHTLDISNNPEKPENPDISNTLDKPETPARYAFLTAYSGLLAGRNDWDYFVPPVYDAQQPDGYFKTKEREISELRNVKISESENGEISELRNDDNSQLSKRLSQELQLWLFHQYRLLNARGEVRDLVDLWQNYYDKPKLRQKYPLPPGGTGDCCAPKLLQYAYQHGLKPLCMAEFWWGAPTKEELRQHLSFYPACRGKCKPLLTWMLEGLDVDPDPELAGFQRMEIPVVYEDEWLLIVNKPSGMLSVPGRIEDYSVETVMQQRYPGSMIAHRLDMGTSGLLIVAKNLEVYRNLQEQFIKHQIKKKYLAVVEIPAAANSSLFTLHSSLKGRISLPLRPDPMNRPRQMVDVEHGKRAITDYEILQSPFTLNSQPSTLNSQLALVALWPQTGRTHQLRIHCAHPDGLGCPIVGDELYGFGNANSRLMLHAAEIWFRHPITEEEMHFELLFPH